MKKQDLRIVEYKNYSSGAILKGLFHRWRKSVTGEGTEILIAVIEDLATGKIVENDSNDLRFISQNESEDFWSNDINSSLW